ELPTRGGDPHAQAGPPGLRSSCARAGRGAYYQGILISQNYKYQMSNMRRAMSKRLIRWGLAMTVLAAIVLGLSGRWADPWLVAYVAVWGLYSFRALLTLDEDLARERFTPPTSGADRVWLGVIRATAAAHLVVGSLDTGRWHVADGIQPGARLLGLAG